MKTYKFALLLCISFGAHSQVSAQNVHGNLEITVIDVGQGDAIFIKCPTGDHCMLIDAGDTRYPGSSAKFKAALPNLTNADKKIDVVVASHPHADHIGSMKWVLENFDVVKYLDDGQESGTTMYELLMDKVHELDNSHEIEYQPEDNAPANFIDFCPADNVNAEILLPNNEFDDCSNPKNCSVVIRLDYGTTSFLFVGDAEKGLEKKLLADTKIKKKLNVNVLKAGHHGSNTSSTLDFVKAVSPDLVVVSVGEKNVGTNKKYKHPQLNAITSFNSELKTATFRPVEIYDKTKKKWTTKNVKKDVFFTREDGNVVIMSDGTKIWKN